MELAFVKMSEDRYYKNERRFLLKMAEVLNAEAIALARAGAPMVQFDEPALVIGTPKIKLAIEGLAIATQGVKAKTAVYTYFGSLNGTLEALLRAPVDLIGVDLVSEPSALAGLKRAKIRKELAIGCLDARNTKLEATAALQAMFRTMRAVVPNDRLYVNPNCGLEFLPHTQALAKLQRLVAAARAAGTPCC